jgi:outer membrane protein OmpA-like peptidoglycan-associated protein
MKKTTTDIYILFICLLLIAAISLFSKPEVSSGLSLALVDSLNAPDNIYFDFGKSELKTEAFPILDQLAGELVDLPGSAIEVIGHTDDVGSYEFNLNLSERRAEAVKDYLVSKGCKPEQIITDGKGKIEPVNANISEVDRSLNRD